MPNRDEGKEVMICMGKGRSNRVVCCFLRTSIDEKGGWLARVRVRKSTTRKASHGALGG